MSELEQAAGAGHGALRRIGSGLLAALVANRIFLLLTAIYVVVAAGLAWRYDFGLRISPFSLVMMVGGYSGLGAALLLFLLLKERPERPLPWFLALLRRWRLAERFVLGLPIILAMPFMISVFSNLKAAIPLMNPFALDPLFADIDRAIFGREAWEVIQPLVGYPAVTWALNGAYHFWIFAFYAVFAWVAAWTERPLLRTQYLIAFFLSWTLIGNLGATLLSSVGPCFYVHFYGEDRYAPLMAYLGQADAVFELPVLDVQALLLAASSNTTTEFGAGISAMPSMHVAITTLMAILAWKLSRVWGIIATVFLAVIVIGSVHLAYHYAIDSVSGAMAAAIWWLSGRIARLDARWLQPGLQAG